MKKIEVTICIICTLSILITVQIVELYVDKGLATTEQANMIRIIFGLFEALLGLVFN